MSKFGRCNTSPRIGAAQKRYGRRPSAKIRIAVGITRDIENKTTVARHARRALQAIFKGRGLRAGKTLKHQISDLLTSKLRYRRGLA